MPDQIPSNPLINVHEINELVDTVKNRREPRSPNNSLKPHYDGTPDGRSPSLEPESATSFQTVDDMGHESWIEYLKYHEESANVEDAPAVNVELNSAWATLLDACVKPAIDPTERQSFLPLGQLRKILSPSNVDKLLTQQFSKEDLGRFANKIYDAEDHYRPKRLKIMGTLLLIQCLEFLEHFIGDQVTDDRLPFKLEFDRSTLRPRLYDRYNTELTSLSKCKWKYCQAEFFVAKQMQLCSLFCSIKTDEELVDHFRLPGDFVLPFLNCKPPVSRYGGFGKITKVEIEPSHLWYRGEFQKPAYFAVKTIRHDPVEHPGEADSLAKRLVIREPKNRDHLQQLLFSFRRADLYYLVFEWADGDLTDLWEEISLRYEPSMPDDVCWFFQQCLGISRSLDSLHNLHSSYTTLFKEEMKRFLLDQRHGRHSDIKPQNILWFKNYREKQDHLIIADLGLTEFHTTQSKSQAPWAGVAGYTQTYKAPESDVNGRVGSKYDIWALGCVFLEHASVFLRRDAKCVKEFSRNRTDEDWVHPRHQNYASDTFYYLEDDSCSQASSGTTSKGPSQAMVKDTVKQWIEGLQNHGLCSDAMRDFLKLIGREMLVVNQEQRSNGSLVIRGLQDILQKCKEDAVYACSSKEKPIAESTKAALGDRNQDLAGISGGQENPDTGLELPRGGEQSNSDEVDLTTAPRSYRVGILPIITPNELSSLASTTRSMDVSTERSTERSPIRTPQTTSPDGSQSTSPTTKGCLGFD